jgi:type IV pilus assembly protein PilF
MVMMRAFRVAALALLAIFASGCVTTTEGGFKADRKEEVARRVDAATQYLQKGNTEQAIVHLRRALEIDPHSAPVNETLARVFAQSGEYELADQHFRTAIQYDPAFSRARNNYAAFLYDRGRIDDAIVQLEQVVADTLYEKRADAFTNLGKAYLRKGQTAKAEEVFGRAIKMDRRQAAAMLELADINVQHGQYPEAARLFGLYRAAGPQPTPRSLLLGIRIARATGDRDNEASYALQLKGLYPESDEYRTYQAMPPAR